MHTHNDRYLEDTYRPCPEEDEEPIVDLTATEEERVNKDNDEEEKAPTDRGTDNTNGDWGRSQTNMDNPAEYG